MLFRWGSIGGTRRPRRKPISYNTSPHIYNPPRLICLCFAIGNPEKASKPVRTAGDDRNIQDKCLFIQSGRKRGNYF